MQSIQARNVSHAYVEALWRMKVCGVESDSRNGKVKRIPGPVITTYNNPTERMLRDAKRDANPFFHIFEGIWMLAGRNDAGWIKQFNSNIGQFSDDGETFHGAYGYRWRNHWGKDQIRWAIKHLENDPGSRRCVIQMFDPESDQLDVVTKDIPCNTAIYFDIWEGKLNMTVTNRSNDMIWGAYGANAVHMSMLQEFVANALGVPVGKYVQFSNNFHIYERHFDLITNPHEPLHYTTEMARTHVPLVRTERWVDDLIEFEDWIETPIHLGFTSPYILQVLMPMYDAWGAYKVKERELAFQYCSKITSAEVRTACMEWLQRRNWEKQA